MKSTVSRTHWEKPRIEEGRGRILDRSPEEDCLLLRSGRRVFIASCRLEDPEDLLLRSFRTLQRSHPRLSDGLDYLYLPYESAIRESNEPLASSGMRPGASGGISTDGKGVIIVWGSDHAADNYLGLSLVPFEHELSHIAGHRHGVPRGMGKAWEEARRLDAEHQAGFPELELHRSVQRVCGIRRRFGHGSVWLNHYVTSQKKNSHRRMEDWAESVSFHLASRRRQGKLWKGRGRARGQVFDFDLYNPHRAALIDHWLGEQR